MKLILTIFILGITLSTFGQTTNNVVDYSPISCYKAKSFNVRVFVKTNDSIATIDWFYEEGVPRCFFSDTLLKYNSIDTIWKSNISKIYLSEKLLYLYTTNSPYEPNLGMRVKLKSYKIEDWESEYLSKKKYFPIRCVQRQD
jgi:hypothetical protein